ncbi:MAG: hypothetical protein JW838_03585 [Spirochaetes bacterium]|nr:hypothetical protein [Spirochaetota bacterium]
MLFLQFSGRRLFFRNLLAVIAATMVALSATSCEDEGGGSDSLSVLLLAPKTATLGDGGVLTGTFINTIVTVEEDANITLRGTVLFKGGSRLVINPGVTFKGDSSVLSYLIIDRGSRIYSNGTLAKPVTFTSDKDPGSRASQDWGGIVINGRATINAGLEAEGEGDSGFYGGTNDNDNSGSITYTRVMFAGRNFSATNELNGLCLQGVGRGTVIDYVQLHRCSDDGIEMFGGTVDLKHIASTGNEDDQIDCTFGWRGRLQFAIAAPLEALGDAGFEFDNNEDNNDASPRTNVTKYNITFIRSNNTNRGARWRRGTHANLYNGYFNGAQADRCFTTEDGSTQGTVGNTLVEECGATGYTQTGGTLTWNGTNLVDNAPATPFLDKSRLTQANLATDGAAAFAPNAAPTNSGTPVAPPDDGFFDVTANYIGAVESAASNWVDGWTEFPVN